MRQAALPSIAAVRKYQQGSVPVPVRALRGHRCNLETAPGSGVEVNRNVGLTQLCDEQKAGKTHPFGISRLAVRASKLEVGKLLGTGFNFISEGSRVDLGCFPSGPVGWGRGQTSCLVLPTVPVSLATFRDTKTSGHLGFHPQRLWPVWSLLWVGDSRGCSVCQPSGGSEPPLLTTSLWKITKAQTL